MISDRKICRGGRGEEGGEYAEGRSDEGLSAI